MYKHTQIFRALKRTGRYLDQYPPCIMLHPNKWFKTQDINCTKVLMMCSPGHSVKVPSQQLPLYQPPNLSLFFSTLFPFSTFFKRYLFHFSFALSLPYLLYWFLIFCFGFVCDCIAFVPGQAILSVP